MKALNNQTQRTIRLSVATIVLCGCLQSWALAVDFSSLVKKAGKFSDDVELKQLDEFAQQPGTIKAGRDILEKSGRRADDAIERARLLRKALSETLDDVDPALLRQLDELDEASQQAALVLSRGARNLEDGIPDVALRGRFLQDGGGETLCTLGRYDDLMDDAIRFDTAVRAGNIKVPPGARSVTLKEFGNFFYEQGDRAHHFWVNYVRPHWKLWLGGSALTAVMLAPDEYLDPVGDLTREGVKKVAQFGGDVLGGALVGIVEGAGEGTTEAARKTSEAFFRTFLTSVWGIVSLVVLATVGVLSVPWTRRRLFGLFQSTAEEKSRE